MDKDATDNVPRLPYIWKTKIKNNESDIATIKADIEAIKAILEIE